MSIPRELEVEAERTVAALRQLVTARGPDGGRRLDRLKPRSLDGGTERLLARYEAFAGSLATTVDLTRRDGDGGALLWLVDLGRLDGDDILE